MKERIKITTTVDIGSYGVEGLFPHNTFVSSPVNVLYERESDGTVYATQRHPISQVVRARDTVTTTNGRGIYYWEAVDKTYIVNGKHVYDTSYGNIIGTITAGLSKVTFAELGDYLVILDSENDEGWTIDNTGSFAAISDPDFPPNQGSPFSLAAGGAVLNNVLYVFCENGRIYNSDIMDPTSWNALNFLTAERKPDKGVFLTSHHDHLVAVGTASIEFFYDAANPVGSPLRRRSDTFYNVGAYSPEAWCSTGDSVTFVGSVASGTPGIYRIEGFKNEKISTSSQDILMSGKLVSSGGTAILTTATVDGHEFTFVTYVIKQKGKWQPRDTYVYDSTFGAWSLWMTFLDPDMTFPVLDYSQRLTNDIRQNVGLMLNGNIFRFEDRSKVYDSISDSGYVLDGYVEAQDDYVARLGVVTKSLQWFGCLLPEFDGGIMNNKFMHKLEMVGSFVGDKIQHDSEICHLFWYDDGYRNTKLSNTRQIDIEKRRKLTRLGLFNRRAFLFLYIGDTRVRFEGIEVDYEISDYA